jgi:hypothetical protein
VNTADNKTMSGRRDHDRRCGSGGRRGAERVLASVTIAGQPDSPNDSWFTLARALP